MSMTVSPTLQLITIVEHPQQCVLLRIGNDGRSPYSPRAAYGISTARTVSKPAKAQDIRRQWKRRFFSLAGCVRRLPAPKCLTLAFLNRLTTAIRSAIARIELAFAAFANVPYQDAQTRLELMQLLEDLVVDSSEGWQP
jgi:hypothetical protein